MSGHNKKQALIVILVLILALLVSMLLTDRPSEPQARDMDASQKPAAGVNGQSDVRTDWQEAPAEINKNSIFTSRDDVALYLHTFGNLPENFLTKVQARALGWQGGDLRPYAEDVCIGGDIFNNYEGLLPIKAGRVYYECDINTLGMDSRGAKRIVYSSDGLIYYTDDHYMSFILLYGEDAYA